MEKLYVVIRSDLPVGLQFAQGVHAAIKFTHDWPAIEAAWYLGSNNIVILEADDEQELCGLVGIAESAGIACSAFQEPDLDNEYTAVAFEPRAYRMLRRRHLIGRDMELRKKAEPSFLAATPSSDVASSAAP